MHAEEDQEMLDCLTTTMVGRSMGIDITWSDTMKFAVVITQYRNRNTEVFYTESLNEIYNHIMQL
jgi:hypothetical protein